MTPINKLTWHKGKLCTGCCGKPPRTPFKNNTCISQMLGVLPPRSITLSPSTCSYLPIPRVSSHPMTGGWEGMKLWLPCLKDNQEGPSQLLSSSYLGWGLGQYCITAQLLLLLNRAAFPQKSTPPLTCAHKHLPSGLRHMTVRAIRI